MDATKPIRIAANAWLARRPEFLALPDPVVRRLLRSGLLTWGTKSFEFWTLLMVALRVTEPASIVELGSGRSTSYLAEYAGKTGVPFVSIEQSRAYTRKVRRGLRSSFLGSGYVRHVPLDDDGWYRQDALDRAVSGPCELLFVDGPVGEQERLGHGERTTARALDWLRATAAHASLVVVDDVHRPENLLILAAILEAQPALTPRYLHYEPAPGMANILALCSSEDALARIGEIASELRIDLLETLEPARAEAASLA
jgi:hypothetical protein